MLKSARRFSLILKGNAYVHDFILTPYSGLEHILVPRNYGVPSDTPGVTIELRADLSLASVIVRKGKIEELCRRAEEHFGVVLPRTSRQETASPVSFIWAGPGQWLALTSAQSPQSFDDSLREAFSNVASVANQSDGRNIIRIGGPKAREILAKGVPIDLDARAFRTGDTALTLAGHINVHFWQVDDGPTYDFAVFRSFAASFFEWILDTSAEFGGKIR